MTNDLLTITQAADIIHGSESAVRGYIRRGELVASRILGKRVIRIRRADLEALLVPIVPQGKEGNP